MDVRKSILYFQMDNAQRKKAVKPHHRTKTVDACFRVDHVFSEAFQVSDTCAKLFQVMAQTELQVGQFKGHA